VANVDSGGRCSTNGARVHGYVAHVATAACKHSAGVKGCPGILDSGIAHVDELLNVFELSQVAKVVKFGVLEEGVPELRNVLGSAESNEVFDLFSRQFSSSSANADQVDRLAEFCVIAVWVRNVLFRCCADSQGKS